MKTFLVLALVSFELYAQLPSSTVPTTATSASDIANSVSGIQTQPQVPNTDTINNFPDNNIQNKAVRRRIGTQDDFQNQGVLVNPNIDLNNGNVLGPITPGY